MRLWSLHPSLLDSRGLVALWREALLAQAVLHGKTRGYTRHPQLLRFRSARNPRKAIAQYLTAVHVEATRRGYQFDRAKIVGTAGRARLAVTKGQLQYEWLHLRRKLKRRDPQWMKELQKELRLVARRSPRPHSLFRCVPGAVAAWEKR